MVDSLLKEVMRKYAIDPERIYISGLSNGGTGTFDYASLWPQRFSATVETVFEGALPNDCALYARTLADSGDPYLAYTATMTFDVPK